MVNVTQVLTEIGLVFSAVLAASLRRLITYQATNLCLTDVMVA